jgi:hypothetical protein
MLVIRALPRDWPALEICIALLDAQRASDEVIDFGLAVAAEHANKWGGNISEPRDRFLARLETAGRLLPEHQRLLESDGLMGETAIVRLQAEVERDPASLFGRMHHYASRKGAIPFLWDLPSEATDWRVVLFGEALRVGLSSTPLTLEDCRDLCDQALEVARSLPTSPLGEEYQNVFAALRGFCDGDTPAAPSVQERDDLLSRSHCVAMEVVAASLAGDCRNEGWFYDLIARGQGWIEDRRHSLRGEAGSVSLGGGVGTQYFPPALRIALAAAGHRAGLGDIAAKWMDERHEVLRVLTTGALGDALGNMIHGYEPKYRAQRLLSALAQVDAQIARTPGDASLYNARGHVLLLLDRMSEARDTIMRCLRMKTHDADLHPGAWYELACICAREGDHEGCHTALESARPAIKWMGYEHLVNDPDLAAVRQDTWFQELADDFKPPPPTEASVQQEPLIRRFAARVQAALNEVVRRGASLLGLRQ